MKKKLTAAVLSDVMLLMSGSVFAAETETAEESKYSGEYGAFEQMAKYVAERYIDDSLTEEEIMKQGLSKLLENNDPLLVQLLKSMLESLDDYSEFYTPEEYKAFQDKLNQNFYGIGISMKMSDDGYVEIVGFLNEDSKAEKAGLKIGDKICKVDGENVTGWSISEVRNKIIGEENTSVRVSVLRDGEELEFITTRVAVHENSVNSAELKGNIGYIQITTFNSTTTDEFTDALDWMREKNIKKIILDLRNNGGGLVSSSVEIAQQIVKKGKIIDVKFRDTKYNVTYESKLDKPEFDFAVLVNEHTASASEILASAIQDSKGGTLIGTKTFGKAVIQNTYPLSNGSVFKLTTGQYVTRNGKEINHIGLTPDVEVENITDRIDTSKYTPFDYTTKQSYGNSSDNVKAAKERLYLLDFYNGNTDSDVFDDELKTAIKDFQKANDLLSYGVLDIPTQKKIEKVFSKIEVTTDNQFEKAYELMGGNLEDLN